MKKNEKMNNNYDTVYSSEHGKMCTECGMSKIKCKCKLNKMSVKGDGVVRIILDKKGRKGKGMTVITGIPLDHGSLKNLAKKIKQMCATGGSVKSGAIEIQGDHRVKITEYLKKHGNFIN